MKLKRAIITVFIIALAGSALTAVSVKYQGPTKSPATESLATADSGVGEDHKGSEVQGGDERNGEHAEEKIIQLTDAELEEFGIEIDTARPGKLQVHVTLPGEIVVNADRLVHIVPRVSGIVREVRKSLGDPVRAGEVMAVLESRELADAKSAYLAAKERVALAEANYRREEGLWKKKISPEQDYLEAKKVLAETSIELRAAEQKLHAIGFSEEYLAWLSGRPDQPFTRYEMVAPFDGTVVEKHITLGEVLKDDAQAFVIADLSSVWVDLKVYQKDLPFVRQGQSVVITAGRDIPDARGEISYVGPIVGEETRTALARVVLPNPKGLWRPGLFVNGRVVVDILDVPLVVPKTAIQTVDGKPSVFIKTEKGFEPQPVTIGQSNETHVEITAGIAPGQEYVVRGVFTLKAQLSRGAFGGGHAH